MLCSLLWRRLSWRSSEFSNLKRGVLSVQASQTIANYWLPRHLAAFRSAYPLVSRSASMGNTAQVATEAQARSILFERSSLAAKPTPEIRPRHEVVRGLFSSCFVHTYLL